MSIWPIPAAPGAEVALDPWRVFELQLPGEAAPTRHLVGRVASGDGRVTSPIVQFDWRNDTARTRSGRVYRLGKPGFNEHATFALEQWRGTLQFCAEDPTLEVTREVTREVLAERQAARTGSS